MSNENMYNDSDNHSSGESTGDDICRDFLRNVCRRGKLCRFRHPDPDEAEALGKKDLVFCHDFQNKECRRPNCKFVHCSKQDEEYFRSTGRLPDSISDSSSGLKSAMNGADKQIPICKDYLKGECRRSGRCKFRHISGAEYQMENANQNSRQRRFDNYDPYDDYNSYEPQAKRRAYEHSYLDQNDLLSDRRQALPAHYRMLEQENRMLMHKVEELKKQVADLTVTNEFLLDQNAQLRVSKQTLVSPISQQLIPHTLTPTLASIPAPSITQLSQLPLSRDLGTASLGPDLAAATQTMAPMVPVTLGQGIAPVSIAPSQVTLPPISAALSQSLPHTLITSTALVSYPIMTQSMRPVIPQSMGH